MSRFTNVAIAAALAAGTSDEFGGSTTDNELIQEIRQERADAAREQLKGELMELYPKIEAQRTTIVANIRAARATAKREKDRIEALDRAQAYGEVTGNFVPVAVLTVGYVSRPEHVTYEDWQKLTSVPEDFEVPKKDQ